jgi:hypothetical protein
MFYTYLWLREDGTVFYVGKGKNGRAYQSHKGHRPPKEKTQVLIQEFLSEEDAFLAEIFLISYFGRRDRDEGTLNNHSDGGDRPPVFRGKRPESTCKKMSLAQLGNTKSRGVKRSPETRVKMGQAKLGNTFWLGKTHSPSTLEKMRESAKQRWRRKCEESPFYQPGQNL